MKLIKNKGVLERGSRKVVIEGMVEGRPKGEDVAVLESVESTRISAAIDGISSSENALEAAKAWARLLSKVSLDKLEDSPTERVVESIMEQLKSFAIEEFGDSYEDLLRGAVFSAVFSVQSSQGWRHIFIWNGDGSAALLSEEGVQMPFASNMVAALPFDILKGLNDRNAVIPNRVFNGKKALSESEEFTNLLYSEDLLYCEFTGEGRLIVYSDGLRDAYLSWFLKQGGSINDWSGLVASYEGFLRKVAYGEISEEDVRLLAKGEENHWDDITYVVVDF